jgi:hypothetical protein
MSIKKIGSPQKIHTITASLGFDVNLAVKKIKDATPKPSITIDEIHEALKALGITTYTAEDMQNITNLLPSVGLKVIPS